MKQPNPSQMPPPPVTLGQAFWYWLKLGFISFGGPAGQIAIMHQDLVEKKRWISEKRFLHALNYCMLLPGPEAQQLATYIGWLMHRTWGGVIAGILFILPSLFLLILLSWIYLSFGHVPAVAGVLYGIKPAVTAIVLFAAHRIGSRALKNGLLWTLAALAFLAIFVLHAPFPLIVLIAACLGAIGGRIVPDKFTVGGGHGSAKQSYGPALIDDDTPIPDHARFSWPHLLKIVVVGLILWGGVMGLLCGQYGWNSALTQMGWFFTKAALLTFGGAYAVLPYVYQGAVEHYHWLSATQMIDGLALGETTPGPLDYDRHLRWIFRRLEPVTLWPGCVINGRCGCGGGSNLLHLSVQFFVYPGGRPFGGIHARQFKIHRAAVGDYRRRGRGYS